MTTRRLAPGGAAAELVALLLGAPYSNEAGVMPLVEARHASGMAMGTLLAFMMSVVAARTALRPRDLSRQPGLTPRGERETRR